MENEPVTSTSHALTTVQPGAVAARPRSPRELAMRLADMREERGLVATFFKDVMEQGVDYGIIPGTDKPTLFKPGAEKLAELYGYAPALKDRQETVNYESGFYRCVITMALVDKASQQVVGEGVGECNTREARYFIRWVPEWKLTEEQKSVKESLKFEVRTYTDKKTGQRRSSKFYKFENDDPWTLWNTVLKMAKKRAFVDVTLSLTRSSGIFSRDTKGGGTKGVTDWIDAEYADISEFLDDEDDEDEPPLPSRNEAPKPPSGPSPRPARAARAAQATSAPQNREPPPNVDRETGEIREAPADDVAKERSEKQKAAVRIFNDLMSSLDNKTRQDLIIAIFKSWPETRAEDGTCDIALIKPENVAALSAWLAKSQEIAGVPKEGATA